MYYIFLNEKGKCFWSDTDYSIQDQIPYYPAPEGVKVGTRCKIIDGVAVADPIPQNEIDEREAREQLGYLLDRKIRELTRECDRRIQTIPAVRRSVIIGDHKENAKTYTDTWFHFHQRCQNILNDKERYTLQEQQSATWVVEQVEKYSAIKRKIKKDLKTMTYEELQAFDPKDPAWWVNGG